MWTGNVTVAQTADNVYLHMDDSNGHTADSNTFDVLPLTLSIATPSDAAEDVGVVMGTISLPSALAADLVVDIASGNPSRLTTPASVTIPAGQTSVALPITVLDNALLDGLETVTITTTAGSLMDAGAVAVHDNETASLAISLPASATEGDGVLAGIGTIVSTAAPTRDIVISLGSRDASELTVPATVVLPAGQTSVSFDLSIVDDAVIDGGQIARDCRRGGKLVAGLHEHGCLR